MSTTDHGAREHAVWSASSTDRNWNCPGALALTADMPDTTNEAADWGTCAHQIAERCLRDGVDAADFIGTTEKGKKHEFEVDEEMADTAQQYVAYVRKTVVDAAPAKVNPASLLQIEQRFSLEALNPPFESGGTADAVIYHPTERLLEVVDLKGGRGVVVEVKGNPQLRTYALGAVLANPKLKVDRVRVTIIQPRAGHKDGRIRSEEFHIADLVEWTGDLLSAMSRSFEAKSSLDEEVGTNKLPQAVWNTAFLKAGDHCKFCKAAGFCPALEQRALDAAGVWFDDIDQPRISNSPDAMSPEKLGATLDMLDMIGEWINAVRSYAHRQAENGVEIPGHILVEKIGNRAWTVGETEVASVLASEGVTDPYTKKIVSPAQAEKLLGAKKKGSIAGIVERPIRGTNLVAVTKTTRPAIAPAVHQHFDVLS